VGRDVIIEQGEFGPKAVLRGPWRAELARYLREAGVRELELNQAKGWQGDDLDFLRLFPDLMGLTIMDHVIGSDSAIHQLHQLRKLKLSTYCKTPVDFAAFPLLTDCALEWRAGSESLFDCANLKRLFINRLSKRAFDGIARLDNLEWLTLLGGPMRDLTGIEGLKQLNFLRLGDLRSLQVIDPIEGLANLEGLMIQVCRRITDISAVGALTNLRRLDLNDCGNIQSLKPLASCHRLEWVGFYGSTRITDGDLSPLLGLECLRDTSFQDRRHYSHRREQIRVLLHGRMNCPDARRPGETPE